jgi:hypothetical protein
VSRARRLPVKTYWGWSSRAAAGGPAWRTVLQRPGQRQQGRPRKNTLHADKTGGRRIAELVEAKVDAALLMARESDGREKRALERPLRPQNHPTTESRGDWTKREQWREWKRSATTV